ncbi:pyridoxamine 5'-phosphate oxidase family protein [Nocardioides coralli]|uniref:pyridoxamine 5'-phosphate oxidase family protein n=1 Tax=Nocardioides coralli TaxID=2872154 RepID=UPI001CA3FB41|nr:pyridoxamine 5'-phosphate oxidase family protein [Nocardioides coralli]QZY29322.1 pyridoxamine 5'-phosphate oxidase family protein [Nocardioides coralli]
MKLPIELTYEECAELLDTQPVGRVALCTPDGPRVFPVNYVVVDGAVVFRTTPYSILGIHSWTTKLAFEVDHVDGEHESGWSVVATGRGALVEDADELSRIRHLWDPRPWAGGQRWLYVSLHCDELTGRRIAPRAATMTG